MRKEVIIEDEEPVIVDFMDEVDETVLNRYKRHPQECTQERLSTDLPLKPLKENKKNEKREAMNFLQSLVLTLKDKLQIVPRESM